MTLSNKIVLPLEDFDSVNMIIEEYRGKKIKWIKEEIDLLFKKDYGFTIKDILSKGIYWIEFRRGIFDY